MNTRDLPGSLDFVQCVDGRDTIIQDYAKVDGWQNAEVMDIIAQLEQSITTREIPPVPVVNFHITDDNIGEGGPKQKFARNIAAIETLFKLESENRNATSEEQEILANFVGWGGLADAFDPDKGNWAQEYQTLKNLLSEDEYAAARASTLNAHYTSPTGWCHNIVEQSNFLPKKYVLMKVPMTAIWISLFFEKQIVLRASLLIRVLKVK